MFIAALFIIDPKRQQDTTVEGKNQQWYVQILEHHVTMKMSEKRAHIHRNTIRFMHVKFKNKHNVYITLKSEYLY